MTKYQKYLKIIGWFNVAMAAITMLFFFISGTILGGTSEMSINGKEINAGTVMLLTSITVAVIYLILAWLCMRGAKDASKVGPIRILALIALILVVFSLLSGGLANFSNWLSLAVNGMTFFCADKVKKGE